MKLTWRMLILLAGLVLAACGGDGGGGEDAYFSDSFDAPGEWRTSADPEVEIAVADGVLTIEIKVIDRVAWSVTGRKVKDGVIAVDGAPLAGPDDNAYGLVVRHVDDRQFYRFEISADGYFAVQAPQGSVGWEFLVDWTESPAIHRGKQTNRLKVVCRGQEMTFFANDVLLATVTDERFPEGDVGVIAGTFYDEAGTKVSFDNFSVEPLE